MDILDLPVKNSKDFDLGKGSNGKRRAAAQRDARFPIVYPYHPWDWYSYLHLVNVGKYTTNGWYGLRFLFFFFDFLVLPVCLTIIWRNAIQLLNASLVLILNMFLEGRSPRIYFGKLTSHKNLSKLTIVGFAILVHQKVFER